MAHVKYVWIAGKQVDVVKHMMLIINHQIPITKEIPNSNVPIR